MMQAEDQRRVEDELSAWCHSYVEAFSAYDIPAIGSHWVFPATLLIKSAPVILKSREAFDANTEKLCVFYRDQGVVRARRELIAVLSMTPTTASIRVEDVMEDTTGAAIATWQAGYTLTKTSNGWRACLADAGGEIAAWAARGTPLGSG
ncbi:MAG: hypothetical protein AAFR33_01535 [Pseudomonadota bacterium]